MASKNITRGLKSLIHPEILYPATTRFFFHLDPVKLLFIFVFLMPWSQHSLMQVRLLPFSGAKPHLLYSVYLILVLMYSSGLARKMPDYAANYLRILVLLFVIGFIRSFAYLESIQRSSEIQLTVEQYILSLFVKPLVYLIPFVGISMFIHKFEQVEQLFRLLLYVTLLLSIFLIVRYVVYMPAHLKTVPVAARAFLAAPFNLHGNSLGNFYSLLMPLVLAQVFTKRTALSIATLGLALIGIAILYSRTVYIVTVITVVVYSMITRRFLYILIALLVAVGLVAMFAPGIATSTVGSTVVQRISKGFHGSEVNRQELSAGRIDQIWIPLVTEMLSDRNKLLFGIGLDGIEGTEARKSGLIAGHPHNMYLELIIDTGLLGFLLLVSALGRLIGRGIRRFREIRHPVMREYQAALLVSTMVYLLSGMTTNSFFPKPFLSFVWVIFGCLVAMDSLAAGPDGGSGGLPPSAAGRLPRESHERL